MYSAFPLALLTRGSMNFHSGKEAGTTFEKLFERQSLLAGLWADPHHIKAKRVWNGHLKELKSDLDYKLMARGGKIGFFDCKTFDEPHFTFSMIDPDQLELSRRYNEWGFNSGFVVWFRPINQVSFFAGWLISDRGPRTRFLPHDGRQLGSWERFDPTLLFLGSPMGSVCGIVP